MSGKVILTFRNGEDAGTEVVFQDRTMCTVGRAEDCLLRLPWLDISRHHCVLDIDPPTVTIRDVGSRNGTYVNGQRIGSARKGQNPEASSPAEMPACDLDAGDEIRIGSAVLSVGIEVPAREEELAGV